MYFLILDGSNYIYPLDLDCRPLIAWSTNVRTVRVREPMWEHIIRWSLLCCPRRNMMGGVCIWKSLSDLYVCILCAPCCGAHFGTHQPIGPRGTEGSRWALCRIRGPLYHPNTFHGRQVTTILYQKVKMGDPTVDGGYICDWSIWMVIRWVPLGGVHCKLHVHWLQSYDLVHFGGCKLMDAAWFMVVWCVWVVWIDHRVTPLCCPHQKRVNIVLTGRFANVCVYTHTFDP